MIAAIAALFLQATPEAGLPSSVVGPKWERRPSAADVERYYPEKARRQQVSGRAAISCTVNAGGGLVDCKVVEDFPAGFGFGEAVLRMSSLFKLSPVLKDGRPVEGGTIKIPLRFLAGGVGMDALSAMLGCYGQTAVAAEREPNNLDLVSAYTYFAAQVAFREREALAAPRTFEANLAAARQSAAADVKLGPEAPTFKQCVDAYRSAETRK
jgi:TonB family protein